MRNAIQLVRPVPPHEIITAERQALGWSCADLARQSGLSEALVRRPDSGKARINVLFARRLSAAFDTTPEFWLNLQQQWTDANKPGI